MDRNAQHAGLRRRWSSRLGAVTESAIRVLGRLAKRLEHPVLVTVPVSAAMLHRVNSVEVDQPLDEIASVFVAANAAQLPVMDHGVVVGVVTRDAVAAAIQEAGPHALVGAAPYTHVVTVAPSDALGDVLAQLRAAPDSIALVVDNGAPVGVLTQDMLVAYEATRNGVA